MRRESREFGSSIRRSASTAVRRSASTAGRVVFLGAVSTIAIGFLGKAAPTTVLAQDACNDTTLCANGVFCSGFEEGSKAIWDDYDGNPDSTNLLMSDPGPCARAGNHVMRLRVPPGSGAADLVKVLPGSYDKLYARWYEKWESGYDFTARNHGSGLHAGSREYLGRSGIRPSGSDFFFSWFEPMAEAGAVNIGRPSLYTYYRGMYQNCSDPNGSCWGDFIPCLVDEGSVFCSKPAHRETTLPPQLSTNRWYCIEMMLDAGTPTSTGSGANGVANYWLDGVQYGPWGGLWFRTTANLKLTTLFLNLYHHEAHSVAGVMLDDVVVSTQRVGCHGVGLPAAPTNLRIVAGE